MSKVFTAVLLFSGLFGAFSSALAKEDSLTEVELSTQYVRAVLIYKLEEARRTGVYRKLDDVNYYRSITIIGYPYASEYTPDLSSLVLTPSISPFNYSNPRDYRYFNLRGKVSDRNNRKGNLSCDVKARKPNYLQFDLGTYRCEVSFPGEPTKDLSKSDGLLDFYTWADEYWEIINKVKDQQRSQTEKSDDTSSSGVAY